MRKFYVLIWDMKIIRRIDTALSLSSALHSDMDQTRMWVVSVQLHCHLGKFSPLMYSLRVLVPG